MTFMLTDDDMDEQRVSCFVVPDGADLDGLRHHLTQRWECVVDTTYLGEAEAGSLWLFHDARVNPDEYSIVQ